MALDEGGAFEFGGFALGGSVFVAVAGGEEFVERAGLGLRNHALGLTEEDFSRQVFLDATQGVFDGIHGLVAVGCGG